MLQSYRFHIFFCFDNRKKVIYRLYNIFMRKTIFILLLFIVKRPKANWLFSRKTDNNILQHSFFLNEIETTCLSLCFIYFSIIYGSRLKYEMMMSPNPGASGLQRKIFFVHRLTWPIINCYAEKECFSIFPVGQSNYFIYRKMMEG